MGKEFSKVSQEIQESLSDVLRGNSDILIFYARRQFGKDSKLSSEEFDRETEKVLNVISGRCSGVFKALLELQNVQEDIALARKILKRYPWHGTNISKLKHFELNWFLIQNLCYKYKEKLKLYYNAQKIACPLLGESKPGWLKAELKLAETSMGKLIRARGNTVHSWDERHDSIDWFGTVQFFHNAKQSRENFNLQDGFSDLDGHYRDTKSSLVAEAAEVERVSAQILLRVLSFHAPTPKYLLAKSQGILDDARKGNQFSLGHRPH